jgi:hypothetical protein
MTFIDRTNSTALQKKSRAVQENLHVQKLDVNHFIPHCIKCVKRVLFMHEKVFSVETQVDAVKAFECTKNIFTHEI